MAVQRLPLAVPIMSRDGTLDKGAKLVNVYAEAKGPRAKVYSRPGISTAANTIVGFGQGLYTGWPDATSTIQLSRVAAFVGSSTSVITSTLSTPVVGTTTAILVSGMRYSLPPIYYGSNWFSINHIDAVAGSTNQIHRKNSLSTAAWSLVTSTLPAAGYAQALVYNNKLYGLPDVVSQDDVGYTTDASTWATAVTNITSWAASSHFPADHCYVEHQGTLYAISPTSIQSTAPVVMMAYTTSPETSWALQSSGTFNVSALTNGRYVVMNDEFYAFLWHGTTSTNRVYKASSPTGAWSLLTSTFPVSLATEGTGFLVADGYIYAVGGGDAGSMYRSGDGITWHLATTSSFAFTSTNFLGWAGTGEGGDTYATVSIIWPTGSPQLGYIYNTSSITGGDTTYNQSTIATISNPNSVPVDLIYTE